MIRRWLKPKKKLPPSSKGNEFFAYFNLPSPTVGWAMSRLRRPSDEEFERADEIDRAIADLHRPFSDEVRRVISYDEIHYAIYRETLTPAQAPYR